MRPAPPVDGAPSHLRLEVVPQLTGQRACLWRVAGTQRNKFWRRLPDERDKAVADSLHVSGVVRQRLDKKPLLETGSQSD